MSDVLLEVYFRSPADQLLLQKAQARATLAVKQNIEAGVDSTAWLGPGDRAVSGSSVATRIAAATGAIIPAATEATIEAAEEGHSLTERS
jgi:hypothetical protein